MKNIDNTKIAVIGIGCKYPGAGTPKALWENILARRRQFREMPDVRLPLSEYFDEDPAVPDKLYQKKAALLDGYSFDWKGKKIPKKTYESTDLVHWLTLDTALEALSDAGYTKEKLPKDTTGVVIGNTLTGEITRSNQMALRWPYVKKVLKVSLQSKGLAHHFDDLETVMEAYYKSVFFETNEDTLAGGLANTIAGRVCNFLDVHGGGFIVDGACSSSLLAVCTAANYLSTRQMDLVIAGGVDISLDTFELIGFSKTGALTRDEMRVYDKQGKGFLPGEGCGVVLLKRLEDALRDQDQIYATLNGWGISSDGKGGITAPSGDGQAMALKRAYEMASFNPADLSFIEGHGTGTAVGDKTELEGIAKALNSQGELAPRSCGVTSFKSIVGHTKAAAGVGAFIKTTIALNQRVLPPTAGFKEPNPIFADIANCVYAINNGEVRNSNSNIFAGVSAMGFGGINSHVLLQSFGEPFKKLKPEIDAEKLFVTNQETEIYLFSAHSPIELKYQVAELMRLAKGISYAEMADLAKQWNEKVDQNLEFRASAVANVPFELERKLDFLFHSLPEKIDQTVSKEDGSILYGRKSVNLKVAAVFPGQGSQKINIARRIIQRHDWAKKMFESAHKILQEESVCDLRKFIFCDIEKLADETDLQNLADELKQTETAQPAIILSSVILFHYLSGLGVRFNSLLGHSLGELMSFYAAGYLSFETLLQFAAFRGQAMSKSSSGIMLSLMCSSEKAQDYINKISSYVTIANINAPEQTVLSGERDAIKSIIALAERDGVSARELPVSAAFHSDLIKEASDQILFWEGLKKQSLRKNNINLLSSFYADFIEGEINLNEYFAKQAVGQVNFLDSLKRLNEDCNLIFEVGPSKVLSGLGSLSGVQVLPVESNPQDDTSLNILLAHFFVKGGVIALNELYAERLIRPFVPAEERSFIVNPLERPFPDSLSAKFPVTESLSLEVEGLSSDVLNDYMSKRGTFLKSVILADLESMKEETEEKFNVNKVVKLESRRKTIPSQIETAKENNNSKPKGETENLILNLIAEKTGFSLGDLNLNMRLLDDLNMDSIKAGSFIAETAKMFDLQGKIESSKYANATIREVVDLVDSFKKPEIPFQIATEDSSIEVKKFIYDLLTEKTGFPSNDISLDMRLLDDLNMDSIKAGSFIAEISKRFSLQNVLKASEFSNARIVDIIETVNKSSNQSVQPIKTLKPEFVKDIVVEDKVQSYVCERVNQVRPSQAELFVDGITLISTSSNQNEVGIFSAEMERYCSKVEVINVSDLYTRKPTTTRLVVFVPSSKGELYVIQEVVSLFALLAQFTANNNYEIYFVQRGKQDSVISSSAFASSLHIERPQARIKVVQVDKLVASSDLSEILIGELLAKESFSVVYYDDFGVRYKKMYKPAYSEAKTREKLSLDSSDVVLVTGGAKGITAECALALASKYGCKMALVGSSASSEETEATLKKYNKLSLNAEYFQCNITDPHSVSELVEQIENKLGSVSCVIHGAGLNKPRRSEQVSAEEALKEISPKLLGAINLINTLSGNSLKIFVAFTSIIGVTGMQGNSWYAFSNEALNLLLQNLNEQTGIETLSLAYSVWSEVGMGARMGSTKTLEKMGIGSISPEKGIEEFLFWIENKCSDQQIIIAADLGNLDTWNVSTKGTEGRFLEKIVEFRQGEKLISEVALSRVTDKYLDDHNFNGSLLFPTVFGLEAMVQNAAKVLDIEEILSVKLENITLQRPIVVSSRGESVIQISSTVSGKLDGKQKVYTIISTEESNFTVTHFSAEISFNTLSKQLRQDYKIPEVHLPLEAKTDLYSWLLFQGEMFQNIDKVYELNESKILFSLKNFSSDTSELCFSGEKATPFILGSPLLRDILLQAPQMNLTHSLWLPIKIKEWEINNLSNMVNSKFVLSEILEESGKDATAEVISFDENFMLAEKISGYEIRALKPLSNTRTPHEIANVETLMNKKLKKSLDSREEISLLDFYVFKNDKSFNLFKSKEERRYKEQQIFNDQYIPQSRFNLKSVLNCLTWSTDNKPAISNSKLNVSISHSKNLLAFSVGESLMGCDIEFVENRPFEEWQSLLGKEIFDAVFERTKEDFNLMGTRLWCVKEAVFKAKGNLPPEIFTESIEGNDVVFRVGSDKVFTTVVELWPDNSFVIAVFLEGSAVNKTKTVKNAFDTLTVPYDSSTGQFVHEFSTTFRDCRGLYGKTYFTNIPQWMGHLRELFLRPVAKQLLENFMTGEYGMVTNDSSIKIYDETETLEPISAKMTITDKSDFSRSFIDLHFQWFKHNSQGEQVLLAESNLSTTWVKIVGHGLVKLDPLPAYFLEYLERYVSSVSAGLTDVENNYPSHSDLGKLLYQSSSKVRPEYLVSKEYYQTGLIDGNSVGNLYYSNYYDWQAKNIERLVYRLAPETFLSLGRSGEYLCLEAVVNHLQEAMPFEDIHVNMYLQELYQNGFKLFFEYFSVTPEGKQRKLAYGFNTIIWAKRANEFSSPKSSVLPGSIMNFFNNLIGQNISTVSA